MKKSILLHAAVASGWLMMFFPSSGLTQQVATSVIQGPTPPELAPSGPANVLALSGFDNIDLYSGHLTFGLPIHGIGGRGDAGYTITLPVSNPPWSIETDWDYTSSTYSSAATAKWWHSFQTLYTPGFVVLKRGFDDYRSCPGNNVPQFMTTMTNVAFLRPDGSEMVLYSAKNDGSITWDCANNNTDLSRGSVFRSRDGSGTWFLYDGTVSWCSTNQSTLAYANSLNQIYDRNDGNLTEADVPNQNICGTLYFRNGVRYLIDMGRVRKIIDRSGNTVQLGYCGDGIPNSACEMLLQTITDPVGRTTSISYGACTPVTGATTCDQISYPGYGGANRTIQVSWGPPTNRLRPDLSPVSPSSLFPQVALIPNFEFGNSPSAVVLPDNVSSYAFYYNPYGEVARVVLPTGGAIDYEYGQGLNTLLPGVYASGQVLDTLNGVPGSSSVPSFRPYVYRRLLKRRQYVAVPPSGASTQSLDSYANTITTYATSEAVSGPIYLPNPPNPQNRVFSFQSWSSGPLTVTTTGDGGVNIVTRHTFSTGRSPIRAYRATPAPASPGFQMSLHQTIYTPDPLDGAEYLVETPGLQTVNKAYTVGADQSPQVCQESLTLSSVTRPKLFAYDGQVVGACPYGLNCPAIGVPASSAPNNLTDVYEYDFGAGPAFSEPTASGYAYIDCATATNDYTRHTQSTYIPQTSSAAAYVYAPGNTPVLQGGQYPVVPSNGTGPAFLPSLVSSVQVLTPSGLASQSNYTYDSGSLSGTPIPNIDPAFGSTYTTRGNLTQIQRLLNSSFITTSSAPQYDLAGNPLQILDGDSNSTTFSYADSPGGGYGSTGCSSGPGGSYAFVTQITNALGQKTNYQWDCNIGRPVSITDPNNSQTSAQYADSFDRLTYVNKAGLVSTSYSYPSLTDAQSRADVNTFGDHQNLSEVVYDGLGREFETRQYVDSNTCPSGRYTDVQKKYDAAGRLRTVSNPGCGGPGPLTTYTYDALDRLTQTVLPDGAIAVTNYSGDATTETVVATEIAPNSIQRQSKKDAFGRLKIVVEDYGGANATTSYSYNALDDLISVNQSGQIRNFRYDSLGRITVADNPESRPGTITCPSVGIPGVCYTYDNAGNLKTRTDTRGVLTTYNYDALNRVVAKFSGDNTLNATFEYDCTGPNGCSITNETAQNYAIGRMSAAISVVGGVTSTSIYRYDAVGRAEASQQKVVSSSQGTAGPYPFHYDYVPAGISNMKYPSGRQVATTYNQAGQANGLTGYVSSVQYTPHGALQQLVLGSGAKEVWTYNSRLQPTALNVTNQNTSANLLALGYSYSSGAGANGGSTNNVGNVLSQTITPGTYSAIYQSYGYDHFDRLSVASEYGFSNPNPACPDGSSVWCQLFSPDPNYGNQGNRIIASSNLGIQSPSGFDGGNHSTPNNGTGPCSSTGIWCYDASGNLVRDWSNQSYAFDAEGRTVAFCPNQSSPAFCTIQWNIGQAVYTYDAEGRRVQSQLADGTQVVYVYDAAGQLAAEYGGTNTATGTQYLTADPLGSTRMVTASVNGSPCATARLDYIPYGFLIPSSFSNRTNVSDCGAYTYQRDAGVRQKFIGNEHDSESGLEFFKARHMASAQGRFISPDPSMLSAASASPQSWNRYTYSLNNPFRFVDPNGELWVASGDANNPYSWVDECQQDQKCYETIAVVMGNNLRVYGSENAQAITNYAANAHGLINVATLAGNADANYESIQTRGREENYLGVSQAAALFNVAAAYGQKYPNDDPLVFTGGSTETGGSALDANGQPIHRSHRNGANVDLRYMGDEGTALIGRTAAGSGDVERNEYIMSEFTAQNANLGATLTGDPSRYGLGPIPAALQQIHQNHMHFQQNYPAPPRQEPRIRPGQR